MKLFTINPQVTKLNGTILDYLYELDAKIIDYVPASLKETYRCKPIYKTFKGWNEDISKCKTYDELPQEAKDYVEFIEKELGIKFVLISVGPDQKDTIIREDIF